MKRLTALLLTGVIAVSGAGMVAAYAAGPQTAATALTAETQAEETAQVYLVPGENASLSGATKLSDNERVALYLETDVYYAGDVGDKLPIATTTRTAKDGGELTFNGWWGIMDATITYFTEVPEVDETFYLYADFRADLSQPMEPVKPVNEEEVLENYMTITRAATGKTETVGLYVSATDVPNAVGSSTYGGPVQFYNEWFELSPGDTFKVFVSGVFGSRVIGAVQAPQTVSGKFGVQLESSGSNSTATYIDKSHTSDSYLLADRYFTCKASSARTYRMYIKFYDAGGTMTVYLEPMT